MPIARPARTYSEIEQEKDLLTPMIVEQTILYNARPYYLVNGRWLSCVGDGTWKRPYLYHEVENTELIEQFNQALE